MSVVRRLSVASSLLLAAAAAAPAAGGKEGEVEELRRLLEDLVRRHDAEMGEIRAELERLRGAAGGAAADPAPGSALEEQVEEYLDRLATVEDRVAGLARPPSPVRLLDISLTGLFAVGTSTASGADLETLQGGGHDPRGRGFSVQNVELALSGAVDPYLRGDAFLIAAIDADGETVVELEEAFLTTTSLPGALQVKAGHFFTEFGRTNASHPHSWDFVDRPVVNTRMFGPDGMRAPGARVSWLAPTEFPLEVLAGAQNATGETMTSFGGERGGEVLGGRPWNGAPVRTFADLVWSGRVAASLDAGEGTVLMPGASVAAGPNGSGPSARSRILGADLTVKWKPGTGARGGPFLAWQTEAMARSWQADEYLVPGEPFHPHGTLRDRGLHSQVVWGFRPGWTLGLRWDWAEGRGGDPGADPQRDHRTRGSAALTWFPSEFSKVRLQVSRDRSGLLGEATSVWLQFEFLLGAHGAHRF